VDVASDQTAGIVVNQDPAGGTDSSRGATVTLSVSRGPTTSAVPDVTGQDVSVAQTILDDAGFRTRVEFEDTDDPALDGIVTSQDPAGGTQAKPDSIVVLFVGRFVGTTTEDTETTPVP
jgi:serine/threonine-protein kinase